MTQQELAGKAGVDVKTVGSLETRGRWPIARSRVSIEKALGWQPGEMDRIAERGPGPAIPPDVLAVIRKRYPDPEQQREIIEKLEAIGQPGEPPGGQESSGSPRRTG